MTIRKITIDNSVRYFPQSQQTQSVSRGSKPNMRKNVSIPKRNKTKGFSQNGKRLCKDFAARGFGTLD